MEEREDFSLTAAFDELTRNSAILSRGIEKEFLRFVENCGDCRLRWENAELECQRLNIELTRSVQEIQVLETKLRQARTLLDAEQSSRKKAESERDKVVQMLTGVRDLVDKDEVCKTNIEKIKDLTLGRGRKLDKANLLSPGIFSSPICGLEVTEEKSVLDIGDLSYDSCDDTNKLIESPGLTTAEIITRGRKRNKSKAKLPNVEEIIHEENVKVSTENAEIVAFPEENDNVPILRRSQRHNARVSMTESMKSTNSQNLSNNRRKTTSIIEYGKENVSSENGEHVLLTKTALKSEKCSLCDKRVKFGKPSLRCSRCKLLLHCECESKLNPVCNGPPPSPILPVKTPSGSRRRRSLTPAALTLTPSSKRQRRQMFQSPMLR